MARASEVEKMSYAELTEMENQIQRLKVEKQNDERVAVRKQLTALAKEHGFDIHELLDGRRKGKGKGSVAAKYRDPKNAGNTWTGRGRMPRWMTAATKGGKASNG
jgi:DNA-binding protein H-NS